MSGVRSGDAGRCAAAALVVWLSAGTVCAADVLRAEPPSATDVNRRVTDPVSSTWSLQLTNKLSLLDFGGDATPLQYQLTFKPTLPVWLTRDLKLIARPDFTLIDDTPYANAAGGVSRTTGVGDTIVDLVLSPRLGAWLLALGPTFVFPTANLDQTGQGKWQLGPAGVVGYKQPRWLAGLIWQQWWSVAGAGDRRAVSELHVQYLASWFFGDGWSLGTAPVIKVNWRADGEAVTFPVGPALARVVHLGTLPVKLELRGMYVPIHPDDGPQGMVEFLLIPVVPSLIVGPLVGPP